MKPTSFYAQKPPLGVKVFHIDTVVPLILKNKIKYKNSKSIFI